MIRMEIILLLICVGSFATAPKSPAIGTLVRSDSSEFIELVRSADKDENGQNIEIQIQSDESFDISSIPANTFEYSKNAMLLFCKILNQRFLNGRRPPWSLTNLETLGTANDETVPIKGQRGNPVQSALLGSDRKMIEKQPMASMNEKDLDLVGQLLGMSKDILLNYDAFLQPKGYPDKAFYHDALYWLGRNIAPNKTLNSVINEIIQRERKAKNHLFKSVPASYQQEFFSPLDNKWKNSDEWEKTNMYHVAMSFIDDMYISGGNAAKSVPMKCTDIEIYEKVINYSHPIYFTNIIEIETSAALRIVDESLHEKSKEENSSVRSPYTEGMKPEKVNLDDSAKFPPGSVRYVKHSAILFVEAINRKFSTSVLSETTMTELNSYPERYAPYEMLRYCTFQYWFLPALQEIRSKLAGDEKMEQFMNRSFLYRLFGWFRYRLSNNNKYHHSCEDLYFELNKFLMDQAITHPLAVTQKPTDSSTIFDDEYKSAKTIEELMTMGVKEDRALFTILSLTNQHLLEDRRLLQNVQQYLEKQPKTEKTLSDLRQCQDYIRANGLAVKRVSLYGNVVLVTVLCEKIDYYQKLIRKVGSKNFETIFYCTAETMEENIRKKLQQSCETK